MATTAQRCPRVTRRRLRRESSTVTWALAVLARLAARAARAFSTSARAFSTAACWFSTEARAASTWALAWLTLASKDSGSMRAISWPFFTTELKSACSSLIWPEICEPTCTVITALRVPVAETAEVRGPRVTAAVRKAGRAPMPCV